MEELTMSKDYVDFYDNQILFDYLRDLYLSLLGCMVIHQHDRRTETEDNTLFLRTFTCSLISYT